MPMLHFDLDELFEDLLPEEKSKNQNSTDTEHKDKFSRVSREVPQAQQTQGITNLPNKSTDSTDSTKLVASPNLHDHFSDLTEEEEALVESLLKWVNLCQPGEEWKMPLDWLQDSDELREAADEKVRDRNPTLRIWRTGKDKLVCKVFFGPDPPLYRKCRNTNARFRKWNPKRAKTVGGSDEGWMK